MVSKLIINCFFTPDTSVTRVMTAARPMMMPSMVKKERPLLFLMDLMAMAKD